MARRSMVYTEEGVFHILTRGNNKQWIFKDGGDYKVYKEILKEIKDEQPFKLYHYCLMSNHVQLLEKIDVKRQKEYRNWMLDREKEISDRTFKGLFLGTEEYIKRMEGRFKVKNVRLNVGRPRKNN